MNEYDTHWQLKAGALEKRMNEITTEIGVHRHDHSLDLVALMEEQMRLMKELTNLQIAEGEFVRGMQDTE